METNSLLEDIFCLKYEMKALSDITLRRESERWIPGFLYKVTEEEHLDRYNYIINLTADKNILDIACGSGFGSYIIATEGNAKQVIGVDLDNDAIRYANHKFQHNKIKRFAEDAVPRRQVQYSCDFRVVDYVESHLKLRSSTVLKDAFISISSLSEDFFDQFKEGSRIRFFSLQGVPSYHSQTSTITLRYNNRSAFVPAVIPDSNPNPYHLHRSLSRNLSTISHDEECDACLVVLRKYYRIGNFLTPNVM